MAEEQVVAAIGTPYFKWILPSVFLIFLLTGVGDVVLSFQAHLTEAQHNLLETCDTLAKMSAGGIIGLLGGKGT